MRLLHVNTLQLEYFHNAEDAPPYAIISHAWEEEEILFEDIYEHPRDKELAQLSVRIDGLESYNRRSNHGSKKEVAVASAFGEAGSDFRRNAKKKKGWAKLEGCCKTARGFGLNYVWIDTCCIFKGDSSELSEAINSMFAWYA